MPKVEQEVEKVGCCDCLFGSTKEDYDERLPKHMGHLKGRYNHVDAILEAEKIIYGPSDFDVENNKSRFDCVIIHTDDELRSFWFDAWKLFIALVAFYSS